MAVDDPAIFASLAEALADVEGVSDSIEQIVSFAVETLGTVYGGFTLVEAGRKKFSTHGATHATVVDADRLQYELNEGPCVDAAVDGSIVVSSTLRTDDRWPRWGPAVAEMGFNSVLCAGMRARGRRIGALNLYGAGVSTFDREDIELAVLFARQGALALGYARSEEGLRQALETRTIIGQAQGVLMERFEIDADRAFATLRRYSQHHNIRLKLLCQQLVDTRELPGSAPAVLDDSGGAGAVAALVAPPDGLGTVPELA